MIPNNECKYKSIIFKFPTRSLASVTTITTGVNLSKVEKLKDVSVGPFLNFCQALSPKNDSQLQMVKHPLSVWTLLKRVLLKELVHA